MSLIDGEHNQPGVGLDYFLLQSRSAISYRQSTLCVGHLPLGKSRTRFLLTAILSHSEQSRLSCLFPNQCNLRRGLRTGLCSECLIRPEEMGHRLCHGFAAAGRCVALKNLLRCLRLRWVSRCFAGFLRPDSLCSSFRGNMSTAVEGRTCAWLPWR